VHPILGHVRRLALYLLAWVLVGTLLALGLGRGTDWLTALLLFVPASLAYAVITQSAWYVCRTFPLTRARAWQIAAAQVLSATFASAIWVGMIGVWAAGLDAMGAGPARETVYQSQQPLLFVVGALLFWLASAFFYLLMAFEASQQAERANVELGLLAREAELKALRAQIDPHFIFNSLHSISALTASNPAAARRMCLLLADFLRDTLRLGSRAQISLADELALAERFLAIEQVRLGARLQIVRETDTDARACLVPPLLLQPLVENAVNHGVAQLVDGGTIRMVAARIGPTLTITLENPCDPDRARTRGVGLGLELLRNRLTNQYGVTDAVFAREDSGRFRVEVRIPAVTEA
jgi:two-component system, LytTR family, sensor histidine kinase AlgZ